MAILWRHAWRPAILLLAAAVIGYLLDVLPWALLLTVSAYLVVQHWQLARMLEWVNGSPDEAPPEGEGIWEEVFDSLYHRYRRQFAQKQHLGSIVKQFQRSAAAMPDGILLLDSTWRIVWLNKKACEYLGLSKEQDHGQIVQNLIRAPRFGQYLDKREFSEPLMMVSPNDPGRNLAIQVIPYGAFQRLLIARDVTQLERMEQTRRDFVANASHELRTPLTVMRGYIDTLLGDADLDPQAGQIYGSMAAQAKRMDQIIRDLLMLLKLESAAEPVQLETVKMSELLSSIADEARQIIAESAGDGKAALTLVVEADEKLLLRGDRQTLHSICSNLVFNAVNYSPDGGQVTIRWERGTSGRGLLTVSDTGMGIADEHLARITERFYRVNTGQYRIRQGTGLGLAIVKHGLNRHDATLQIISDVGVGSEFRCVFPADAVCAESLRSVEAA